MAARLAERLKAAHHHFFVGREDELNLFQSALDAEALPFHILFVHGPGGVGKTSLAREMQYRCRDQGITTYILDARDTDPSASAFMEALRHGAGLDLDAPPDEDERAVLFIDTAEALRPLMYWLRTEFLPQVPVNLLLVFTGRQPPPASWRSDLGVQALMRVCPLRNLSRAQSETYLDERGIPAERHPAVLDFAHGHPLALSLAADACLQNPGQDIEPIETPDIVGTLVRRFLERVPSAEHRAAIERCALVRYLTEPLLSHILPDVGDTHDLFTWLRQLSFVEASPEGLFPHDVVRETIVADWRWRDAEAYAEAHRQARRYYAEQLRQATARSVSDASAHSHERILTDYLFLYRQNPVVRPIFRQLRAEWKEHEVLTRDAVQPSDWLALRRMVVRHEGEDSADLLDYWKDRQPDDVQVIREADGTPTGFVFPLDLQQTTSDDRQRDPAVNTALAYLDEHAPLRSGETATLFRYWMSAEAYQDISPVQSLIATYRVRCYLGTPNLAYTFIPCANPDAWAFLFAYADLHRLDDADFTVGDHTYGLFGHDWRITPPHTWLEQLAERDLSAWQHDAEPTEREPMRLVLSTSDFADAVKEAFKSYARPDAVHGNPLLRSRVVLDAVPAGADAEVRVEALRTMLRERASQLQGDARTSKYYRALHATYLEPQPTQERAAEHLDLPFSTYRRYLRRGLKHVTESLWRREVGGTPQ